MYTPTNKTHRVLLRFLILVVVLGSAFNAPLHSDRVYAQSATENTSVYLPVLFNSATTPSLPFQSTNAIYFSDNVYSFQRSAVFWFGKVTSSENYADVRVGYTDSTLSIAFNIMDRYLWYDQDPSVQDLANWDAVTLYVSTADNPGNFPGQTETRFVAQLNQWQARDDYQTSYRGNGTGWVGASLPFSTVSGWRGEGLNDNTHPDAEDKGWLVTFHIPFSSLGYSQAPHGKLLRLAISLHDRDAAAEALLPDTEWPESMNALIPATWGGLHLGLPVYQPPAEGADGTTVIRNGSQGAVVTDAHVGGAFDCGASVGYDWERWGNTNYEAIDPSQINIQNQRDISDWPCFSKYYVTFPLDQIPSNARIVSASLTMYHFGNSLPQEAYASNIHVLSVTQDWSDTSITWNNAPQAWTNYSRLRVEPLLTYPGWPGIPVTWDVGLAVVDALTGNTPLRLVLYASDDPMHSGKYFHTSDSGGTDHTARPYLTVKWIYP